MKVKNIFLSGLLLTCGMASAQESMMTVVLKDGTKVEYDMEKVDKVQMSSPSYDGEEAEPIDLHLTVKWASHNLGAKAMTDAGGRYTFKEAKSNAWSGWRVPTEDEWRELYEKCQWTWTICDGIPGRLVTSSNGASIFIPASGFMTGSEGDVLVPGAMGSYWTSDVPIVTEGSGKKALGLYFDSGNIYRVEYPKTNKFSVRLVKDDGETTRYHNMLLLQLKDSQQMSFLINGKLKVKENDSLFIVTSQDLEYSLKKVNVKSYSFKMDLEYGDGIKSPEESVSGMSIEYVTRGIVKVCGIKEADLAEIAKSVGVYNIQGQKQNVIVDPQTSSIIIRLTSLPQSTYIVSVKGVGSLKINN